MVTMSRLVPDLTADGADRTDAGYADAGLPSGVHRPDEQLRRRIQRSARIVSHSFPDVRLAEVVAEVHGVLNMLNNVDVEIWRDTGCVNPQHAQAIVAKVDRLLGLTGSLFDDSQDSAPSFRPFPGQRASAYRPTALTRRQWEVAGLIAAGLRNADIAQQLQLASGTVANHIAHIMERLGCRSRAQIAVWVTELRGGITGTGRMCTGEQGTSNSAVPRPRTR